MKTLILTLLLIATSYIAYSQTEFIKIETNKTLCLFSFLETIKGSEIASPSFQKYLHKVFENDTTFAHLMKQYSALRLEYHYKKEDFPESRLPYQFTKDLIWIAASNASDLDDLNERITGLLPHSCHSTFIDLLKKTEPYYDSLIWTKEQEHINRIETQLSHHLKQIENLFLSVSHFYKTPWNKNIPFKIMLYPIPLAKGGTSATPKGNLLICGFLSHNENDYKQRLGIIIHEMCHILYQEQPLQVQRELEHWFDSSSSSFSKFAYNYIDEGLATAIGNGWGYAQIHGTMDTTAWYNDEYINGFSHELYPLTTHYLSAGKSLDHEYITQAIHLFEQKFPKANHRTEILLNNILLYTDFKEEHAMSKITTELRRRFNIRSWEFLTPITDPASIESFTRPRTTKLFIIESTQKETLFLLQKELLHKEHIINGDGNRLFAFLDKKSESAIIILTLNTFEELTTALDFLKQEKYLSFGKRKAIE